MFKELFKEGYRNERRVSVLERYTENYIKRLEEELTDDELFDIATMKLQDDEEYLQIVLRGAEMKTTLDKIAYCSGTLVGDIYNRCNAIKRYLAG